MASVSASVSVSASIGIACPHRRSRLRAALPSSKHGKSSAELSHKRRELFGGLLLLAGLGGASGLARAEEQPKGTTPGRVPGLNEEPDVDGYYQYTRPNGKGGGHGVGWSEFDSYTFRVPEGWEEKPVSIADLGGTEIDLRFEKSGPLGGKISGILGLDYYGKVSYPVVIAPVLRFKDVGFNANISLKELGDPEKIIEGFAPEILGGPLEDGQLLSTAVDEMNGYPRYKYEIAPRSLITISATGNRVYIMQVSANGIQWRKNKPELMKISDSFTPL